MHVFSGMLDEDFLVELSPKLISEHVIFKIFLGHAPDFISFSMLCMLVVLCTTYTETKTQLLNYIC